MQIKTIEKKNKKFLSFEKKPSTMISFRYSIIAFIIALILMLIVPTVLNYGPGTINTPFDVQMSYISYNTQYALLVGILSLAIIIFTKLLLKDVDKWYIDPSNSKYFDYNRIQKMRKKSLLFPYVFFGIEMFLPFIVTVSVLSITGSHSNIMIGKILILVQSFAFLLAVISFIFSKDIYDQILSKTYIEGFDIGVRISLKNRIFLLIFPIILAGILFTSLLGYSASIIEKGDTMFYNYKTYFSKYFDINKTYSLKEINYILKTIETINPDDTIFLLAPDDRIQIVKGNSISNFLVEYIKQLSEINNGRLYDSYGVDVQGYCEKLKTEIGDFYVGITFEVESTTSLLFLGTNCIFIIIIGMIVLYIFGSSITKSIHQIAIGFQNIADNSDKSTLLPVTSNDEIGDLIKAFNAIQKLNTEQLQTIKNNQTTLIEQERLASLGQMIGGIAHNLKTPIFSISGGLEGLSDLINEFDSSIEDPTVNDNDMHEIAKDMREWIDKLKVHTSYMSDVITAVKGQASTLMEERSFDFTIEELFKQVDILMKHELKNALINLNIENKVENTNTIDGNINSLVQIINNIISNAIQAYNGEPNKEIFLSATLENDNIIIKIKDNGPGIPDSVKEKLFKEMITTKGKNGTGLGLFMSYSTIKAHFHGDLQVTSEQNIGTTFTLILPTKK